MSQKLIIGIAPNITIEIDGNNAKEIIVQAAFWNSLPHECPLCNAPVQLFHRDPQDNDYYGLKCTGERPHQTNFGIYKELSKGLFYKGDKSWTDWIVGRDADEDQEGTREPAAEHDRLNKLIEAAWAAKPHKTSLHERLVQRFNKGIKDLDIQQKRNVLTALEEENGGRRK
jgi:hypothetical protein